MIKNRLQWWRYSAQTNMVMHYSLEGKTNNNILLKSYIILLCWWWWLLFIVVDILFYCVVYVIYCVES